MKKRINVSIEYSLLCALKEKGTIKNLSAFFEKCISNHLTHYDKRKARVDWDKLTDEQKAQLKAQEDIAAFKIWDII